MNAGITSRRSDNYESTSGLRPIRAHFAIRFCRIYAARLPEKPFDRRFRTGNEGYKAAMAKATNWGLWAKVIIAGVGVSVGGPALTYWVVPTEEELRSRYNPDLLRKSIEGRAEREAEFNDFVTKLKAYSKSDKPKGVGARGEKQETRLMRDARAHTVWAVIQEEEENRKRQEARSTRDLAKEAEARREAMRKEAGLK
ncbi:hypothetical protein LLEC1_01155 [Akanthomyces lecanii]|uniref:Cytochrome b mRNA-processing protein 4 n=1 Tax=Cordyceps confragosa TaxID=2714763 RepID=A0A179IB85_CORDF|nr:hypothetical protein LLEC1_01155 [Akanthomyces lecanii]